MGKSQKNLGSSGICNGNWLPMLPIGRGWLPLIKRFGRTMDELLYQTDPIEQNESLDPVSGKGIFQSAPGESDVHVWSFRLTTSRGSLARFESFLSSGERERAG